MPSHNRIGPLALQTRERVRIALVTTVRAVWDALGVLVSPGAIAIVLVLAGFGALVAGVYTLVGLGWALVAAGLSCLTVAVPLLRGMMHVS